MFTIEPKVVYEVKGEVIIEMINAAAAQGAKEGYKIGHEIAANDRADEWLRHKEARAVLKVSKTTLQKLKVPDGDESHITGKTIRYREFAHNDHRYLRADINAWIASKKPSDLI